MEREKTIVIIAGSNRTGTSAIAEFLCQNGFVIPYGEENTKEYRTYEDSFFKWANNHREFKWKLPYEIESYVDILFKYPKASQNIKEWEKNFPDAKFIYVLREPRKAIWRQVQTWGRHFFPLWFKYWAEYNNGYRNMMQVKNLYIISYERLLQFPELEKEKLLNFVNDGVHRSGTAKF